jgi:alpha-tubulin suppressor-like RCC1 family protein
MPDPHSPASDRLKNSCFFSRLVRISPGGLFPAIIAAMAAFSASVQAETLSASYTTGKEVPLTAAGYAATGNTVTFSLGYAPARGTQLRVVDNTGVGFIQGTFSNLANGAPVDLIFGGITYRFVAWYYGGDGNDLVLLWRDTGLSAWGYNQLGQLGDGSNTDRSTPVSVRQIGVLTGKTVVSAATGFGHSFALCSDSTLAAWGSGSLGNGSNGSSNVPVAVSMSGVLAGKTVIAIAAGDSHKLVLCSDGSLASWGTNNDGQLGDGSNLGRNVPVLVDQGGVLAGRTVVAISAGSYHCLVVCSDGTVAAWGRNNFGQLGDGSTTSSNVPVLVTQSGVIAGKTITALSAGIGHSLALCSDGTLATWGRNVEGQLGDGSNISSNVPVLVTQSGVLAGKSVVAIAAAGHFDLALCSDGTLAAWGRNSDGQLGVGSTADSNVPIAVNQSGVLNNKTVTAVAAGFGHSLVHCSDGTLAAWGRNFFGQIGDGTISTNRSVPALVRQSGVLAEKTLFPIAAGDHHSLALYPAPPEIAVRESFSPHLTDGVDTISFGASVLAGTATERTFIVQNLGTGDLTGLGITFDGPDASSFSVTTSPALQVPPGGSTTFTVRFLPLSGGAKSAALRLASNDTDENPFDISLTGTAQTTVAASYSNGSEVPLATTGLTASVNTVNFSLHYAPTPGTQLRVVNNTGHSFIQGTFSNLANGAPVDLTHNGITYRFVAWYYGGDGNDLVLLWRGTGLAAWGSNAFGQLGDGSATNRNVPVAANQSGLLAVKTVVALAPGRTHSLALCSDGTLAAWGSNGYGQLGNGSTTDRNVPVAVIRSGVLSGKTVVALAAGDGHSLALCSDGTLAAWGANGYGQLGNGASADRNLPVAVVQSGVLAGKTVVALAAGDGHSLALCTDGTLAAWGRNVDGQLGDGSNSNRNVPVAVTQGGVLASRTVVALAAGDGHSLARCSDGTLAAWGRNVDGELGDGSTTNQNIPVAVTQNGVLAGKTVVALAAGDGHNLALCSDGTLTAWGRNNDGQLGDGSNSNSNIPLAVDPERNSRWQDRSLPRGWFRSQSGALLRRHPRRLGSKQRRSTRRRVQCRQQRPCGSGPERRVVGKEGHRPLGWGSTQPGALRRATGARDRSGAARGHHSD